ncbi:hypothetical protein PM082_020394 [Marasmius tenuissimus]|nr:hypothetical protein PM082_020394 [Marasmius tenuissimus]
MELDKSNLYHTRENNVPGGPPHQQVAEDSNVASTTSPMVPMEDTRSVLLHTTDPFSELEDSLNPAYTPTATDVPAYSNRLFVDLEDPQIPGILYGPGSETTFTGLHQSYASTINDLVPSHWPDHFTGSRRHPEYLQVAVGPASDGPCGATSHQTTLDRASNNYNLDIPISLSFDGYNHTISPFLPSAPIIANDSNNNAHSADLGFLTSRAVYDPTKTESGFHATFPSGHAGTGHFVVGSPAVTEAAKARRARPCRHFCDVPGCSSDGFTSTQNLQCKPVIVLVIIHQLAHDLFSSFTHEYI